MPEPAVQDFKFRWVVPGGGTTTLSKKGRVVSQGLVLNDDLVPYEAIHDTVVRDKRLMIQLDPSRPLEGKVGKRVIEGTLLAIEVLKVSPRQLERTVDRKCSVLEIEERKRELEAAGELDRFRSKTCPGCGAEVDLTGLEETRYTFCRFCDTLFTDQGPATEGDHYGICEECGLFGRIQRYPEFYFYFLLIVYGFSYRKRFLCDTCASSLFWKTFLRNLIFVVGVPTSLWVKMKSQMGKDPEMTGLAEAKRLALAGRYREASRLFDELLRSHPEHPGVLMNQAVGHLQGGDAQGAARLFERSLSACNNYLPALRLLNAVTRQEVVDIRT